MFNQIQSHPNQEESRLIKKTYQYFLTNRKSFHFLRVYCNSSRKMTNEDNVL